MRTKAQSVQQLTALAWIRLPAALQVERRLPIFPPSLKAQSVSNGSVWILGAIARPYFPENSQI
jgi:hypothetical protein